MSSQNVRTLSKAFQRKLEKMDRKIKFLEKERERLLKEEKELIEKLDSDKLTGERLR